MVIVATEKRSTFKPNQPVVTVETGPIQVEWRMVSLPVDTLRIGTVLLSLLLLIDTISVVGQFTSPPQLELNTMIDAVLLKKDDQAQEMALKLMRESIAAQEHYAKPDMHTNAT